jgi:outer membrane protein
MRYFLLAALALVPAWSAADAQDTSRDLRVRVGVGVQALPKFIGSDKVGVGPLFHVNTARGTNEFKFGAPDDTPGIPIVSQGGFSFGPSFNLAPRRREKDVGAPVGNVKRTIEAGAFAQYQSGDSFRVRGEVRKGLNGHDGVVGTLSADKIWRDGDRYVFSVGPRVLFSDARYQQAYFGVSSSAAARTGLPVYRPGGGIHAVGIASGVNYALNDRWGLFGYARYERLVGDAAKSPIIREFGSKNQLAGGVGLNYTFTIRR